MDRFRRISCGFVLNACLMATGFIYGAVDTVSVSAALSGFAFRPVSYLLTRSETVSDLLSGACNLEINNASTGGAAVTLANDANTFDGGVFIASGSLTLPATRAVWGAASALGWTKGRPIVLGPGTLSFAGDAELERDIVLLPAADVPTAAAVLHVTDGVTAALTGTLRAAPGAKMNFLKTGPGTFTLATRAPFAENVPGREGAAPKWVDVNGFVSGGSADGDGPQEGFSVFGVTDGRFEIATGETVTNRFPDQAWVGMTTTATGTETAGHMDIRSGVTVFKGELHVGRHNGTTATAPGGLVSSVNVYGGETTCGGLALAYGADAKFTMRPALNVHGGLFTSKYLRLYHTTSRADVTVDGGVCVFQNVTLPYYNDGGGSGAELNVTVSGEGRFSATGYFTTANTGEVPAKLRVSAEDGGEFHADTFRTPKPLIADSVFTLKRGGALKTRVFDGGAADKTSVFADGGIVRPVTGSKSYSGEYIQNAGFYVGAGGMKIDLSNSEAWGTLWKSPIRPQPGVADGGIDFVNATSSRRPFRLATTDVTVTGGIRLQNAHVALLGDDLHAPASFSQTFTVDEKSVLHAVAVTTTVERLVFSGASGELCFGTFGPGSHDTQTNYAHLAVRELTPPSGYIFLRHIRFDTTSAYRPKPGAYDILSFPASAAIDLSRFVYNRTDTGLDYRLTDRVENGLRILTLNVSVKGSVDYGTDARESDAWQSGDALLRIGPYLYVHEGSLETAAPLTLAVPQDRHAGILVKDAETLTLAGGLDAVQGGFTKLGAGTLALTGGKGYAFGRSFKTTAAISSLMTEFDVFDGSTNGAPSVATHDSSVTVGRGTLRIGTGTDYPDVRVPAGTVAVGSVTTSVPGDEGAAALEMKSGRFYSAGSLYVGFCHGAAAAGTEKLLSSFHQTGGTVDVNFVSLAYDNEKRFAAMDTRFTLDGGSFICRTGFKVGQQDGASTLPVKVTYLQNGGDLSVGALGPGPQDDWRMILKDSGAPSMVIDWTMNGGTATFYDGFSCYNKGTVTVNLNGGVFRAAQTFNGGNGTTLNWNGTVFVPMEDAAGNYPHFRYFNKINICEGNAVIDMSMCRAFDFEQGISGPGRVVVRGANTNNAVRLYTTAQEFGGVTAEKGGLVIPREKSGETIDFLVRDGGAICDYYGSKVKELKLGEKESDTTVLYGYAMKDSFYHLTVTGTFSANGTVLYAPRSATYPYAFRLPAGKLTVLNAPKGSIDPAKFTLHPDLVSRGAAGTFAVESVDDSVDALVLTATSGADVKTWTAGGSGDWAVASNWDQPPVGQPHETVVFPETLRGEATVSAGAGATAQKVLQNAPATVRLDGPFAFSTLDNNEQASFDIAQTSGVLEFAGEVSMLTPGLTATMSRTGKGGTLRVTGRLADQLTISKASGYTEGSPESFGAATLNLDNSILRFLSSGVCRATVNNSSYGLGIEVPEGKTVRMAGKLTVAKNLSLIGGGRLELTHPGDNVTGGNATSANNRPIRDVTTGDAPYSEGLTVYAGTLVIDGGEGSTYKLANKEVRIGSCPIPDGTGGAYDARLEIRSGAVTAPSSLYCFCGAKEAYDSPLELGLVRRPVCAVDVYGGSLTVGGSLMMNYAPSGTGPARYRSDGTTKRWDYFACTRASLNVYGGEVVINGAYCGLPYHDTITAVEEGSSDSQLNVSGGVFRTTRADISIGRYSDNYNAYPARGSVNIYGGTVRTPAANCVNLAVGKNAKGSLNLHGGVLETGWITRGTAARDEGHVYFDGGTFRPLATDKKLSGFTTFTVGRGGAKFDLSDVKALTLEQALSVTNALAADEADGGIELSSTNAAAVLKLAALNAIRGPLVVNGGIMRPTVVSAANSATGVVVNAGGAFDANGFEFSFHSLGGDGGVYSNGVVTVTGSVAPSNTTFTVEDIVFGGGAVLSCPVEGDAENGWTAPYLTVTKSVSKAGSGAVVDLGREPDGLLPKHTSIKVAEVAPGIVFPQMQVINAGCAGTVTSLKRRRRDDGVTEVWAEVAPSAMRILVR